MHRIAILTAFVFCLPLVLSTLAAAPSDEEAEEAITTGFSAVQGRYKNAKISNVDSGMASIQERAKTAKVQAADEPPLSTPSKGMKEPAKPCNDQEGGQSSEYKASASIFRGVSVELGSAQQVQDEFFAMLNHTFKDSHTARLLQLESALQQMFAALPKNVNGRLEHGVARYALHRLFLQEHRWFIKGLNATEHKSNSSKPKESIPNRIFELVEKHQGNTGISVHELTALALTLEDLVHKEESTRVDAIHQVFGMNESVSPIEALEILETYMLVFLVNGNLTIHSTNDALKKLANIKRKVPAWKDIEEKFLMPIFARVRTDQERFINEGKGFLTMSSVKLASEEIGNKFGEFNDKDCKEVQDVLRDIAGPIPGRVPLSAFYNKGLYSQFLFNENVDYLRVLGALDESNSMMPEVIVPNYLEAAPNCRTSTSLYSICCRNTCEDLMGRLEQDIASPMGEPNQIIAVVDTFSPSLISKDAKQVDAAMRQELEDLAASHDGKVLLHSHNFANWLHGLFPYDCPFSHGTGEVGSQAADEWLEEMGDDSARATKDEMVCYVNGGGSHACGKTPKAA